MLAFHCFIHSSKHWICKSTSLNIALCLNSSLMSPLFFVSCLLVLCNLSLPAHLHCALLVDLRLCRQHWQKCRNTQLSKWRIWCRRQLPVLLWDQQWHSTSGGRQFGRCARLTELRIARRWAHLLELHRRRGRFPSNRWSPADATVRAGICVALPRIYTRTSTTTQRGAIKACIYKNHRFMLALWVKCPPGGMSEWRDVLIAVFKFLYCFMFSHCFSFCIFVFLFQHIIFSSANLLMHLSLFRARSWRYKQAHSHYL